MYCKYCGTEHAAQQKFCAVCGKDLRQKEKSKKSAQTIVLAVLAGVFAVSTATLAALMPRQKEAAFNNGREAGYSEGYEQGYTGGYTEGLKKFDEGYKLGWEQKQAVIDADIAQTSEYQSWAKAYPELGNTEIDSDVTSIYDELHASIDNWYNMWESGAYERIVSQGSRNVSGANFNKFWFLTAALPYSVEALHNIVDNMMRLENDHVMSNEIFWSGYNSIETALEEGGYFPTNASRYEEWMKKLNNKQSLDEYIRETVQRIEASHQQDSR